MIDIEQFKIDCLVDDCVDICIYKGIIALIDRLQAAESMIRAQEENIDQLAAAENKIEILEDDIERTQSRLDELDKQEPIEWQYQRDDGSWKSFENEKHKNSTIKCGQFNIRPLYLKLTTEDK